MNKSLVILTFVFLLSGMVVSDDLNGQTQRALIIGINDYIEPGETKDTRSMWRPTGIKDLHCALNDLTSFQNMLTANLGFNPANISKLTDKNATREAILNALDASLKSCESGDVFLFYFSGHGSTLNNPMSLEKDLKNETIVPTDGIYKGSDIKDGELAMRFQQFLDKGVILTIIIDSCHSGSIARGLDVEYKSIESPDTEMNDPFIYPNPAAQGALVMSAAQDYQQAQGIKYPDGKMRSAFTKTIIEEILLSNEKTSVEEIFDAVMAKMRYAGIAQIPVMEGSENRLSSSLFGKPIKVSPPAFPVIKITAEKRVLIEAGPATGVDEGSILVNKNIGVTLIVKKTIGINSSECIFKVGSTASIKPGIMFTLEKRGGQGKKDNLKIYLPHFGASRDSLLHQLRAFSPKANAFGALKYDISAAEIPQMVHFSDGRWWKNDAQGDSIDITNESLRINQSVDFFNVEIPIYESLYKSLVGILANDYPCVDITTRDKADYCLFGEMKNGELGYQLIRNLPSIEPSDPYAPESDFFKVDADNESNTAMKLAECAYKISRTKGWLTLQTDNHFPYQLAIRRNNEREYLRGGDVKNGDRVSFFLKLNEHVDTTEKRFVYVFGISSNGSITLLFPSNGSNVENFLPVNHWDNLIELGAADIVPPFGTDHLVMLSSTQPIINPKLISQTGISSRSVNSDGMDELISGMNATSRAPTTQTNTAIYSIDRISLTSYEK